jgi:hypothetical protein
VWQRLLVLRERGPVGSVSFEVAVPGRDLLHLGHTESRRVWRDGARRRGAMVVPRQGRRGARTGRTGATEAASGGGAARRHSLFRQTL